MFNLSWKRENKSRRLQVIKCNNKSSSRLLGQGSRAMSRRVSESIMQTKHYRWSNERASFSWPMPEEEKRISSLSAASTADQESDKSLSIRGAKQHAHTHTSRQAWEEEEAWVCVSRKGVEAVTALPDDIWTLDHRGRRWWWWWLFPWIENKK